MTDAIDPDSVAPSRRIESHIPCHRCGYDLFKTLVHKQCPECGTIAAASIRGTLPLFEDEIWLARVLSGIRRLAITLVAGVLLLFLLVALLSSWEDVHEGIVVYCCLVACFIIWFVRTGFLLSTPDPSPLREGKLGKTRKLVRLVLILIAVQGFASCAMVVWKRMLVEISGIGAVETVLAQGIGIAWVYSHLHYLQHLLRRLPKQGLAKAAKFLKWALSGMWMFQYLLAIVGMLGWYGQAGSDVIQFSVCSGALAFAVGGLGYLIFLGFLQDAFADLLRKARARNA